MSATISDVSGVNGDGFATTVLPASQRRRELPRQQDHREVPRRDRGHDAERLAHHLDALLAVVLQHLGLELQVRVVAEPHRRAEDLGHGRGAAACPAPATARWRCPARGPGWRRRTRSASRAGTPRPSPGLVGVAPRRRPPRRRAPCVPRGQVANGSPRAGLMTSSCSAVVTERPLISMAVRAHGRLLAVWVAGTRWASPAPLLVRKRSGDRRQPRRGTACTRGTGQRASVR